MKKIYKYYEQILQNKVNYYYNPEANNEISIDEIFRGNFSREFIYDYFKNSGKNGVINWLINRDLKIDTFRSIHTVSAYLLGIILKDYLKIDMRELPKVEGTIRENFLYFWSFSCLFHDVAYYLENHSSNYLSACSTLSDFYDYFDLEYNFIDSIKDKDQKKLIQNYYKYRVFNNKIDHGISAAMLLYNGLLLSYEEAKINGEEHQNYFLYKELKYSKQFNKHVGLIAKTIALHNMWRANEETKNDYIRFDLHALIEDGSGNSIVKFESKEKLLFLLGLTDSIEPIKLLIKLNNNDPYIVLNNIELKIDYKKYQLDLYGNNNDLSIFLKSVNDMVSWISIHDINISENNLSFKILKNK